MKYCLLFVLHTTQIFQSAQIKERFWNCQRFLTWFFFTSSVMNIFWDSFSKSSLNCTTQYCFLRIQFQTAFQLQRAIVTNVIFQEIFNRVPNNNKYISEQEITCCNLNQMDVSFTLSESDKEYDICFGICRLSLCIPIITISRSLLSHFCLVWRNPNFRASENP